MTIETDNARCESSCGCSALCVRRTAHADVTLYVRQDGDDRNCGLCDTPEGAFASWRAVEDFINATEFRGHSLTVNIGPGRFDSIFINAGKCVGLGSLEVIGSPEMDTVITNVLNPDRMYEECVLAVGSLSSERPYWSLTPEAPFHIESAGVILRNLTYEHSPRPGGSQAYAVVHASGGANVLLLGSHSVRQTAPCENTVMLAASSGAGLAALKAGLSFFGSWRYGITADYMSRTNFVQCSFNFQGTRMVKGALVVACRNSMSNWQGNEMNGSNTGTRYHARSGGIIDVERAGDNYFPGTAAGVADAASGGFYA